MSVKKASPLENELRCESHDAVIKHTLLFHPSIYSTKAAKSEAPRAAAREPTALAETPRAAPDVVVAEFEAAPWVPVVVLEALEVGAPEPELDRAPDGERVAAGALE